MALSQVGRNLSEDRRGELRGRLHSFGVVRVGPAVFERSNLQSHCQRVGVQGAFAAVFCQGAVRFIQAHNQKISTASQAAQELALAFDVTAGLGMHWMSQLRCEVPRARESARANGHKVMLCSSRAIATHPPPEIADLVRAVKSVVRHIDCQQVCVLKNVTCTVLTRSRMRSIPM